MKNYKIILTLVFIAANVRAQQTIQKTIFLRSNLVNSTEILMYKLDNTNYFSLYSNTDFGIYNSTTSKNSFFISADDNVGIGTITPTERLSVKGKIRAQEVKVELANWPDYVFRDDYQLPSLQTTEQHILAKGHLPGIPSASEVAKDGIELGEMNKKLLQKIEELTLYLIDQSKSITELKSQNKDLFAEIEKIKTKP